MRLCSLNDKSIAKDILYFFRWSNLKEAGHLQNIFTMYYTCTFLIFRLEKRQNIYCHLLKGIMFQYRNGFNIIDQRKYYKAKEEKYRNLS
jgi:hypothetical protein